MKNQNHPSTPAAAVTQPPLAFSTAADAALPAVQTAALPVVSPQQAVLDARGFDVRDFEWFPLPRIARSDGWSLDVQKSFIGALADTGSVTDAAKIVNKSAGGAYKLRREPGGEQFAAAWDMAISQAANRLVDVAFDRAMNGTEVAVVDNDGNFLYFKRQYNDRLLMFLLRAHRPDRYAPGANNPPPVPIGDAIEALEPVTPENPHLLMSPEKLDAYLPLAQPEGAIYDDPTPEALARMRRSRAIRQGKY